VRIEGKVVDAPLPKQPWQGGYERAEPDMRAISSLKSSFPTVHDQLMVYRMTEKKLSRPIATKNIMITSGRFFGINIYPPDLQSRLKSS